MKKTLALLLALLAAASIALASCEKKPENNGDNGWDDDIDHVESKNDKDDEKESAEDTAAVESENNETENEILNNTGWVATNDTVYAGVKLHLRTEASKNSSSIATIPFGTAITRAETNGSWDKVTYNGQTGYVNHTYVSTNAGDFTFTAYEEAKAITLSTAEKTNTVLFYQTPFSPDQYERFDLDADNVLLASGIKAANLSEGYTLEKVAISQSGKWIKVKLTGTVTIGGSSKVCEAETFYIRSLAFTRKDVIDDSWGNGNVSSGDDAFG